MTNLEWLHSLEPKELTEWFAAEHVETHTCQMDMVGRSECICSECGVLTHWVHVDKPNYCHNCGSKVIGR